MRWRDYRLRYDIFEDEVVLHSFRHHRKDGRMEMAAREAKTQALLPEQHSTLYGLGALYPRQIQSATAATPRIDP